MIRSSEGEVRRRRRARSSGAEAAFDAAAHAVGAIGGPFPSAMIWTFSCTSGMSVGAIERVERAARRVAAAEADEHLSLWGSQSRMYLGCILIGRGEVDEGRRLFEIGARQYDAAGLYTGAAYIRAIATAAEVLAGGLERATEHLERAENILRRGERWQIVPVLLARADVTEASGGAPSEALRLRREAQRIASEQGAVGLARRAVAAIGGERWTGM